MKAVVQRVMDAAARVKGRQIGTVEKGLLVYLGVATADTKDDLDYLLRKCLGLRIFPDEDGKMNLSITDLQSVNRRYGVLVISQFTLIADTRKGRRPSYNNAAEPVRARELYEQFVRGVREAGIETATGEFGEHMDVRYTNDGPVTIIIDSQVR